MKPKTVKIKKGTFKGESFKIEGELFDVFGNDSLAFLACTGNFAAKNALEKEKYTIDDRPFYYGKIGSLGYILSEKEWS